MHASPFHLNLLCAWLGILLGFLSGMAFGLFFHRENWLGGYASFQRRMYRLGHISFFGLAIVNFMFYLTAQQLAIAHPASETTDLASTAFILGAISMPVCCLLTAHFPGARLLFSIPVLSLLVGGVLTLVVIIRGVSPPASPDFKSESRKQTFEKPTKQSSFPSFSSVQFTKGQP
jgi:hypothetical protein